MDTPLDLSIKNKSLPSVTEKTHQRLYSSTSSESSHSIISKYQNNINSSSSTFQYPSRLHHKTSSIAAASENSSYDRTAQPGNSNWTPNTVNPKNDHNTTVARESSTSIMNSRTSICRNMGTGLRENSRTCGTSMPRSIASLNVNENKCNIIFPGYPSPPEQCRNSYSVAAAARFSNIYNSSINEFENNDVCNTGGKRNRGHSLLHYKAMEMELMNKQDLTEEERRYLIKRIRNNQSAKKSRDTRREKEGKKDQLIDEIGKIYSTMVSKAKKCKCQSWPHTESFDELRYKFENTYGFKNGTFERWKIN